jgi:hypothetical protein
MDLNPRHSLIDSRGPDLADFLLICIAKLTGESRIIEVL